MGARCREQPGRVEGRAAHGLGSGSLSTRPSAGSRRQARGPQSCHLRCPGHVNLRGRMADAAVRAFDNRSGLHRQGRGAGGACLRLPPEQLTPRAKFTCSCKGVWENSFQTLPVRTGWRGHQEGLAVWFPAGSVAGGRHKKAQFQNNLLSS